MSNTQKVIIIIGAVLMLVIGFSINMMVDKLFIEEVEIETEKSEACGEAELYYSLDKFNIYTYCLDSVKISINEDSEELSHLLETKNTLDNLLFNMEEKEVYKDGGSKLYVDEEKDIAVLKCNTLEGNRDVYIGSADMKYEDTFCKNEYEMVVDNEFEVTYELIDIIDANDEDYKFITVKIPNTDFIETVKVESKSLKNVTPDGSYTFKFKTDKAPFKNNIKNTFELSKIVSIKKTDK